LSSWTRHARHTAAAAVANSPVVVIGITFSDRDANKAKITFYTLWTLTIADVWALAETLASRLETLSDAALSKIEILYRWRADDPPDPPESSNIERKLLLLITNPDDEINGLIIPSPGDLFEPLGPYAGIRVDLLHPAIVTFQAALEAFDYRTGDDHALGQVVAAGGLAL
jgi:hypothetical protein